MTHRPPLAQRRPDRTATAAPAQPPVFRPARALDAISDPPPARAPLMREIHAASDYLRFVRRELAALGANELAKGQIPAAIQELDYIVEDSAEVTDVVMTAAEDLMNARDMASDDFREFVIERMTTVILQCAVQDICAQRARRTQAVLGTIERRLARIATFVATRDLPEIVDFEPDDPAAPLRHAIGPSPHGEGNDQAAIDRLLALPLERD